MAPMNWGGLNNALFAWRNGLNELLPARSTRSDGGRADSNHASTSQHQPDPDGTVDAFDEDHNYLGSSNQAGSAAENRIHAALNADFRADPRAHLIICDRTIQNDQIGNWRIRPYTGSSPHTEHTHRQVHQSKEDDGRPWKFTHTRAVLAQLNGDDMLTNADVDLFLDRDVIPNPYSDAKTNPFIKVSAALKAAAVADATTRDLAASVTALRGSVASLAAGLSALAAKDAVDEEALAAALAPAVGAYVLAHLPQGSDQVTQEEVNTAVRAAFRDAFGNTST
jgi:hypothetical protein